MTANKQVADRLSQLKSMENDFSALIDNRNQRIRTSSFTRDDLEAIEDEIEYLRDILKPIQQAINAIEIAYEIV